MKATQRNFAATAQRAAREARVFYFCGPDEAGASDAAARISALLGDAEKVEIAGSDLRRDPALLADEARSVSLFGDRRQIHVRTSGDEAHDAVANLIDDAVDGWPVLIVATSATDKSRIAKLLEKRDDALVAMFHPPDLRSVASAVRGMADAAGVRIGEDVAERIARSTALDTRMAKSEVEKLALYLDASPQAPRSADAQALDAIGAVSEDDGFMPLVNTVLGGELGGLSGELARMRELSINPVGLLLAFERRAAQLSQLAGKLGRRTDIAAFLEQERVFFRDKRDLENQLRRWRGRKLERLVDRLVTLHRGLMADNRNGELLLAQGLAEIARAAAR
ncbi:DNA polymerase III subunit delta [Novosphingobium sp. ZN18A2]|uniref:DNA polymerase III subunit delta n=1 Tax=Novosphingobium sp. ZN18A2 TaxID=3079861 RepID=UPI0030CD4B94